jgi:hypothetical protein
VLWTGVVTGTLLAVVGPAVDSLITTVRPPALVRTAAVISTLGQPAVMIVVLVVVVATLGWRSRSWGPGGVGASAVVVLGVLDNGVKAVVHGHAHPWCGRRSPRTASPSRPITRSGRGGGCSCSSSSSSAGPGGR